MAQEGKASEVVGMTKNDIWLAYVAACNQFGWNVSAAGYRAFLKQVEEGFRDKNGTIKFGSLPN